MKYILFFFISFSFNTYGQYPDLAWGDHVNAYPGTSEVGTTKGDADNNVYFMHYFTGASEFGLTTGTHSYNCGSGSFVLIKRNPNGNTEWILPFKNAGSGTFDIDHDGNIVVYVAMNASVNINPNGSSVIVSGMNKILAKYNSNGELIWHKHSSSSIASNVHRSVTVIDQNNNIYCAGRFSLTQDFDFSPTSQSTLSSTPFSPDIFVAKYNSSGLLSWVKRISCEGMVIIEDMDVNNNGDVVLASVYNDTAYVDPEFTNIQLIATQEFSTGDEELIVRINSSGSVVFAKTFQGSDNYDIKNIHLDNSNIFIYHNMTGSENLNPNSGAPFYASTRGGCLRLSSFGTYISNYPVADDDVYLSSGDFTADGNHIFSGMIGGTVDFDPGPGVNNVAGLTNGIPYFITELTGGFTYIGSRHLSSDYSGTEADVIRLPNNSIGYTLLNLQNLDLDYGAGSFPIVNTNGYYSYVWAHYSDLLPELNIVNESSNLINAGSTNPVLSNSTDFGDLCLNDSRSVSYSLVNTGLSNLTISNISILGVDAASYSLTGTNGVIASGDTMYINVSITGTTVGVKNATIRVQNNDPDEGTYNFDIKTNVRELPNVGYNILPNNSIFCSGDTVILSGTGAEFYSWNNGVSDSTPYQIITNGLYFVTGTTIYGCENTFATNLTVNPLPNVTVSSNDPNNSICLNNPIQLIGSGAQSYSYTNGVIDQTDFYPNSTDNYTVIGTDANGCQNDANITITVFNLPTVTVSSNDPNNEICINDPIQLVGSGASTYAYSNSVIDQTDFYPTVTDTYNVHGTDVNGCVNTSNITIVVNSLPTVSVTSSELNNEICVNDSIQLIGSGASNYVYTNGVQDQVYFNPVSTDNYSIVGTDANGCQNSSSITITVNSLPIIGVSSSDTNNEICLNDSIQLIGSGAQNYTYSNGVIDLEYFTPQSTDSYSIIGTDANGCQNTSSIQIVVNPLPTVTVSSSDPNNTICLNDSVQLIGNGASSYSYNYGVLDAIYFIPTNSEMYTITGTDNNGCVDSETISIVVNTLPSVGITSNAFNDSICINDAVQLIGSGASSYSYSNGIIDQVDFYPITTETYSVIGTDVNGCSNTDSITISVLLLPNVDGGQDLTICFGDSVQLLATGSGQIEWTGSLTNGEYFAPSNMLTELICTTTIPFGCQNSDTINVNMGNQITTALSVDIDEISANSGYANYSWFDCFSGAQLQNGQQELYVALQDGTYGVVITDNQGCSDSSVCVLIDYLSVDDNDMNTYFTFAPNPTRDEVWVINGEMIEFMEIVDAMGRHIKSYEGHTSILDFSELPNGPYFVRILTNDNREFVERIVKQ